MFKRQVGLIDVDGHHYPNLPLMKLSAWHKRLGDQVRWYDPLYPEPMDIVYMSKVFSFSEDYAYPINAKRIVKGGTGYHISLENGKEVWHGNDMVLEDEVEHIYPDYSLYGITDHAYGYLSCGCPRGCSFCVVKSKEGTRTHKVADLDEFWCYQKNITIMDPNILACPEADDLLWQLASSKATVDINQGLDARLLTEENLESLRKVRMKNYHFAWDNPKDEKFILPKLKMFREIVGGKRWNTTVYCLVNFNSSLDEDLHRIYTIRELGFQPYVMIYDKAHCDRVYLKLQRWVNSPMIFWKIDRFENYRR